MTPPFPIDIPCPPAFPSLWESQAHQPQQQQLDWWAGWAAERRGWATEPSHSCPLPQAPPRAPAWCAQWAPSLTTFPTPAQGPLEVSSQLPEAPSFWTPQISRGYLLYNTTSTLGPSLPLKPNTDQGRTERQGKGWQRTQWGQVMGEEARSVEERREVITEGQGASQGTRGK